MRKWKEEEVGLDPSKVLFGVSGMYAVNAFKVLTGLLGIAVNVVLLVIPYYYLHNAWLNFKDKK